MDRLNLSVVPIPEGAQKGTLRLAKYPMLNGVRDLTPFAFKEPAADALIEGLLPLDFCLGTEAFRVDSVAGRQEGSQSSLKVLSHISKAVKTALSAILGKLDQTGVYNSMQLRRNERDGYLDLSMAQVFSILHAVNIAVPFTEVESMTEEYKGFEGQMALCRRLDGLHPKFVYEFAAKLDLAEGLNWSYVSTNFANSSSFVDYIKGQRDRNSRKRLNRKLEQGNFEALLGEMPESEGIRASDVQFLLRALASDGKFVKPGSLTGCTAR